jgi:hypothetical protein
LSDEKSHTMRYTDIKTDDEFEVFLDYLEEEGCHDVNRLNVVDWLVNRDVEKHLVLRCLSILLPKEMKGRDVVVGLKSLIKVQHRGLEEAHLYIRSMRHYRRDEYIEYIEYIESMNPHIGIPIHLDRNFDVEIHASVDYGHSEIIQEIKHKRSAWIRSV